MCNILWAVVAKIARIACGGGGTCTSRWRERKGEMGGVIVVIKMFYDGKRGRMVWVEVFHELWW